ncbi:type II toxin-antitoxin system prevent-host-death family antitoxin [Rhizobium wenxiniae]|uniref:type II toxin-antitoxin system prevent-host-death family antitoxin n=1 Tax=Rhizobium wenxiniae TaxID=1737357 RepID=UPI001C6F52C7|nr:type II toxin-antitoxin system prevent-host-death family antitoxin [Rhizobium wenxiniae]MBW9086733.1 type II toxin-antitoxin system prevent-host-death family antitoxin [Rhizobium wenxiniae]
MRISIAEAEGKLAELVKLAEQGEEVLLTQTGSPPIRLEIVRPVVEGPGESYDAAAELAEILPLSSKRAPLSPEEKRKLFDEIRRLAPEKAAVPGPDAAHSQDFLYDEFGLPK